MHALICAVCSVPILGQSLAAVPPPSNPGHEGSVSFVAPLAAVIRAWGRLIVRPLLYAPERGKRPGVRVAR